MKVNKDDLGSSSLAASSMDTVNELNVSLSNVVCIPFSRKAVRDTVEFLQRIMQ